MSRRALYSLAGALLALGAPLGLLLLEAVRAHPASGAWLVQKLAVRTAVYVYVTVGTLLAFTSFGYVLGREGDALSTLARTDPLTGLLNRRALTERLHDEVARAARYKKPLSLLLLDLDGLKRFNDRAGHHAGDAALQALARSLRERSRSADLGARWGGDEFVLLAPETRLAEALELAERIRASVASNSQTGVTASIGIATVEADEPTTAEALEAAADRAVYEAKRLGGNRVVAHGTFPADRRAWS
jgi:diguanylate cyclase (GGDEF)-like protein